VTRTLLKCGGELMCLGRTSRSCSISDNSHFTCRQLLRSSFTICV